MFYAIDVLKDLLSQFSGGVDSFPKYVQERFERDIEFIASK